VIAPFVAIGTFMGLYRFAAPAAGASLLIQRN